MNFAELQLEDRILKAIEAEGYSEPTPVQAASIPHVLAGRDLCGCAQTGTGKTAAFALPILHRLVSNPVRGQRKIRALVLSPTRELAAQIADSFRAYGKFTGLKHAVVYGGVSQHPQTKALTQGVDILVATPGRLFDLMNQGYVDLRNVEVLVLDEADRMLDMGFIHDIRKIITKIPAQRQTLFFSATMPRDIRQLADSILRKPAQVQIAVESATADRVEQSVYHVDKVNKPALLSHVLANAAVTRALVFTRTKHGADKVVKHLSRQGIRAEAIHGEKSQNARQRALANFKSDKPPVLVATDLAARGLDVDGVSHVINFDVPVSAETYVHRIGRTARAGASGIAISFCHHEERAFLKAIEKLTRQNIPVIKEQPEYPKVARPAAGGNSSGPARPQTSRAGVRQSDTSRKPFGVKRVNSRAHNPKTRPATVVSAK